MKITTKAILCDVLIRESRATLGAKNSYVITLVYQWINKESQTFEVTLNGEFGVAAASALAKLLLEDKSDMDINVTVNLEA